MCRASFYRIVLSVVALAVGCKRQPDWREYVSQKGDFRVTVPATPVESTTAANPLAPSEVDHVLVDRGPAGMFQVTYYSLIGAETMSPETIEAALKLDCTHPFEGSAFTIEAVKPHSLGDSHGVSVTGRALRSASLESGGWEEDRCYLVAGRLYHLIGIAPDTATGRADVVRFLDSFALRLPAANR